MKLKMNLKFTNKLNQICKSQRPLNRFKTYSLKMRMILKITSQTVKRISCFKLIFREDSDDSEEALLM